MKYLFFGIACLVIASCVGTKKSVKEKTSLEVINIASEYFNGANYHFEYNTDSTYLLCYQGEQLQNKEGFTKLNLVVFNAFTEDIIFEDQLNFGSVEWVDHYTIEMKYGRGYIGGQDNAQVIRRYNVRQRRYLDNNK